MPQRDVGVAHSLLVAEASSWGNLFEMVAALFEVLSARDLLPR
jgi:hypothetical protein